MYVFSFNHTIYICQRENQNDRFIGTAIYNVLWVNQPLKLLDESRIRKNIEREGLSLCGLKVGDNSVLAPRTPLI